MALIRHRKCHDCLEPYSVLEHGGETLGMDRVDDQPICPQCGSKVFSSVVHAPKPIDQGYPRFDRGLGIELQSAAHRKQVCAERGLVPVDGDFDHERMLADQDAEEDGWLKKYETYKDKLDNSPEFQDWHRQRELKATR